MRSMFIGAAVCLSLAVAVYSLGCGARTSSEITVRVAGIRQPAAFSPSDISLRSDSLVIGIVVGGQARAYLLEALRMPPGHEFDPSGKDGKLQLLSRHVVNDVVNGKPISVTYCDRTDCKQVFTAEGDSELDLSIAGWSGSGMMLRLGESEFPQKADESPVDHYPFTVTSWQDWLEKHPETDVYVGHLATDNSAFPQG